MLFTHLHLASLPDLTKALMAAGITAIAYETVEARDRSLPMLRPMSEIAGRLSVQVGAHYLGTVQGGAESCWPEFPGSARACGGDRCGYRGTSAVRIAVGLGARVTVINLDVDRLRMLDDFYGAASRPVRLPPPPSSGRWSRQIWSSARSWSLVHGRPSDPATSWNGCSWVP